MHRSSDDEPPQLLGSRAEHSEPADTGCASDRDSGIYGFLEQSSDLLLVTSMDGTTRHVNAAWTDVLGWDRDIIESAPIRSLIHPEDLESVERVERSLLQLGAGEHSTGLLTRLRASDGTYRWIDWRGSYDAAARLVHVVGRNVTDDLERRNASTAHEALLTRLIAQLVEARHLEHTRVANQLHDGPVQNCIAALMHHDTAVATGDQRHFADARAQIVSTLEALKRTMAGLDAEPGSDMGIEASIRAIADEVGRQFQLKVDVTCHIEGRVPNVVGATACRVIREGLVNVGKHAGSPTARVRIEGDETSITATIQDDGFAAELPDRTVSESGMGMGLPALREAVRSVGGEVVLDVDSEGSTLVASMPYGRASGGSPAP